MRFVLLALAAVLVVAAAPPSPPLDVRDFGAVGDGATKDTPAFERALAVLEERGGGTLAVPAGTYLIGSVRLPSHTTLHLEAGAVLLGSPDFDDYPTAQTRWEGVDAWGYRPLIYAHDCEGVALVGRGTVDGNGAHWWRRYQELKRTRDDGLPLEGRAAELARLNADAPAGTDADEYRWQWRSQFLRPALVQFHSCRNVRVRDVTLKNSPFWTLHPVYSDDVVIDGVTITAEPDSAARAHNTRAHNTRAHNTDGIDIDSSTNVRVSNVTVAVGDDSIVIKSGRDEDGRRRGRPTENVAITNVVVRGGFGAITIGSESSGGVRNVAVSNVVIDGARSGIRIKSMRGRGGVVEQLQYSNIVMRNIGGEAIRINQHYHFEAPPEPFSERTPVLRDVVIRNVAVAGARQAVLVRGLEESPVEGIVIEGLTGTATTGIALDQARGVTLRHVRLGVAEGELVTRTAAEDVVLDDVASVD